MSTGRVLQFNIKHTGVTHVPTNSSIYTPSDLGDYNAGDYANEVDEAQLMEARDLEWHGPTPTPSPTKPNGDERAKTVKPDIT